MAHQNRVISSVSNRPAERVSVCAGGHLIGTDHVLAVLADLLRLLFGLGQFGRGLLQLVFRLLRRKTEFLETLTHSWCHDSKP